MKAILFLAGDQVARWYTEDGEGGTVPMADKPEANLCNWFRNGWKIHGGLPTNMNGGTLLLLRDGKPVDKWKARE